MTLGKKGKISTKGFTLIELLVVIAIIGMLSSVVLASLNSARAKGRDARRMADIKQMQLAIEMFYHDNNRYPGETWCDSSVGACNSVCPCGDDSWDTSSTFYTELVGGGYIPSLSEDPINNSSYYYYYEPDGQKYFIRATLENSGTWGVCVGYDYTWCH